MSSALVTPLAKPLVAFNSQSGQVVNTFEWVQFFALAASLIKKIQAITATCNPASIPANSTSEQTFTVTGVNTADYVLVTKPTHTAGIVVGNARVSATDTVAITFGNITAGAIDPASETYTFLVIKV